MDVRSSPHSFACAFVFFFFFAEAQRESCSLSFNVLYLSFFFKANI